MSEGQYPESVADICDAAADHIDINGWRRGDLWESDSGAYPGGPTCAIGAVAAVTNSSDQDRGYLLSKMTGHPAVLALADYLGPQVPQRLSRLDRIEDRVWRWNDADWRTQDEVIQALRDTATKHRSDEMRVGGHSEPS